MSEHSAVWSRRGFLAAVAATGAAQLATPARGLGLAEKRGIKLGFDNFSIRTFEWKAPRLIEYAAALKVDVLFMSDLDCYESLEPDYLDKIRAQAERAGIELHVGTGSICPTSKSYDERKWGKAEDHARLLIRTAKQLGSSITRCYLGTRRDREGEGGIERLFPDMIKVLKAVQGEAEAANVKIAVENHAGDMQAWELVALIESAGKSFVGATMDPGNAAWTLEDPLVNLEILGPYALTTGIRDTAIWETDVGANCMWATMGHGMVDWAAYVKRFQELCPKTPFVLETISYKWSNELPYLRPEFWTRFPKARAHEFARFVALAKRGKPFVIPPGRPSGTSSPELERTQQQYDLEQDLKYCRDVLGLGVKG